MCTHFCSTSPEAPLLAPLSCCISSTLAIPPWVHGHMHMRFETFQNGTLLVWDGGVPGVRGQGRRGLRGAVEQAFKCARTHTDADGNHAIKVMPAGGPVEALDRGIGTQGSGQWGAAACI